MSWLFSRALVAAYSGEKSSGGARSALSRSMLSAARSWCDDRTRATFLRSQCGMTCAHLTGESGAALLTWFRAAFRATTFRTSTPEASGWTASALACGPKWPESFAKFDPVTSSWKTSQRSFLEGEWAGFSATWPRWGIMLGGACWALTMSEGHNRESAFGYWRGDIGKTSPAPMSFGPVPAAKTSGATSAETITPTAIVSAPLTPTSTGWTWWNMATALLPTPLGDDWKGGTTALRNGKARTDQFRHWCKVVHGLTYPIPEHSETVMGWPVGWTDSKRLETDKFREWSRWHGLSLAPASGTEGAT